MKEIQCKGFQFPYNPRLETLLDTLKSSHYLGFHMTLTEDDNPGFPSLYKNPTPDSPPLPEHQDIQHGPLAVALGNFMLSSFPLTEIGAHTKPKTDLWRALWLIPHGIVVCPLDAATPFRPKNYSSESYKTIGNNFHIGSWGETSGHSKMATINRLNQTATLFCKTILNPSLDGNQNWSLIPQLP